MMRSPGLVRHQDLEDDKVKKECENVIAKDPTVDNILVNPRTGFFTKYETIGFLFNAPYRVGVPDCSKHILEKHPKRCDPIKGAGVSRRCPNADRGCQFFFNFQKFLQCYNKFEHLGEDAAVDKCGFFLNGVPPSIQDWYNQCRIDGDWLGIKSNWMPKGEDDDDDEE